MASLVHTYGLFQVSSTDLNGIKPQVNSREQPHHGWPSRVSSSYFWEQNPGHRGPLGYENPLLADEQALTAEY
jgi:hypothetical protein